MPSEGDLWGIRSNQDTRELYIQLLHLPHEYVILAGLNENFSMADFEAVNPWGPELDETLDQELETVGTDPADVLETVTEVEKQGPEGLLFTGDVIRTLTPDQLAVLGDFASRMFGVEMQPIQNVARDLGQQAISGAELEEEEPEPVLVTKEDFRRWAAENGYGDRQAVLAYHSLVFTAGSFEAKDDPLPMPSFVNRHKHGEEAVDLRSVHERLVITEMRTDAWIKATANSVSFLARMVNDLVQPDEPLPASRKEWTERAWDQQRGTS